MASTAFPLWSATARYGVTAEPRIVSPPKARDSEGPSAVLPKEKRLPLLLPIKERNSQSVDLRLCSICTGLSWNRGSE